VCWPEFVPVEVHGAVFMLLSVEEVVKKAERRS
jgi:hypothetical protein